MTNKEFQDFLVNIDLSESKIEKNLDLFNKTTGND